MSNKNISLKHTACTYLMSVRAADCYWAYTGCPRRNGQNFGRV